MGIWVSGKAERWIDGYLERQKGGLMGIWVSGKAERLFDGYAGIIWEGRMVV